jgi:hypothetical protein
VLITLLIILRKQIIGLAERLQEISLSGGAKAIFQKQLEVARLEAESLPSTPDASQRKSVVPETDERRFLRLAAVEPEAAIVEAYRGIETIILDEISPLLGVKAADPVVIVNELLKRSFIDQAAFDLFQTLRRARNVAAHIAPARITSQEAIDYGDHATKLLAQLSSALGKLQAAVKYKAKE